MIPRHRYFLILTGLLLSLQAPVKAIHFSCETLTANPGYALLGASVGTGLLSLGSLYAVNKLGIAGMSSCLNEENGRCTLEGDANKYKYCTKHKWCKIIETIGTPTSCLLLGSSVIFAIAGAATLAKQYMQSNN